MPVPEKAASSVPCPVDEHGCNNPNCLFNPHYPACQQVIQALGPALAFLESRDQPLAGEKLETVEKITDLLGVNNELFLERLYDWINSQKPG